MPSWPSRGVHEIADPGPSGMKRLSTHNSDNNFWQHCGVVQP